ncbi:MAG: NPCBM/NEW2 domain-containing protein [Planctomycetia bacterium]|nr:NPCBM/NEW2 domain-containing protein [Planctomycetia bacterium]
MVIGFCASALAAGPAHPPVVVPREGAAYPAALLRIDADGKDAADAQVMLGVDGKSRTLPLSSLVRFGAPAEPAAGPLMLTADGSWIVVDTTLEPLVLRSEQIACDTRHLGRLELPLDKLRAILFHRPAGTLDADLLLQELTRGEGHNDQVLLDNGDRVLGSLTALNSDKLLLQSNGRPIEIDARNVAAVIFNPTLLHTAAATAPHLMVGLADGTRLDCAQAATDGTKLKLSTRFDGELKTSLSNIVWLQPLGGGVQYLSDLEPAGYRQSPYLDLKWPYLRDRNVLGGQLRAGGQAYLKGLGVHSPAALSYTLKKPYRTLAADVALDDLTAGQGSVVYRVYVDTGDGKWQKRFDSDIIRGGQPPRPITVDLTGAKRISLLVDYADRGDVLDHADWLDARLVP